LGRWLALTTCYCFEKPLLTIWDYEFMMFGWWGIRELPGLSFTWFAAFLTMLAFELVLFDEEFLSA